MSDEQAFLNALTANPADDVCRLAYSDWLEEHNEIGKATYLRLVVRAVEQITNGEDLGTTRDGLWPLISTLDEDWRIAVGRRFDVRLEGYDAQARKISVIILLRELFALGLAEAKRKAENLPKDLTHGCIVEDALAVQSRFLSLDVRTSLRVAGSLKPARRLPPNLHQLWRVVVVLDPNSEDFEDDEAEQRFGNFLEHMPAFREYMQKLDPNVKVEPRAESFALAATFPMIGPRWLLLPFYLRVQEGLRTYVPPEEYFVMAQFDAIQPNASQILPE